MSSQPNNKTISLSSGTHPYYVRYSSRAKHRSVVVHWNGKIEIVIPKGQFVRDSDVEKMLEKYRDWIDKHVAELHGNSKKIPLQHRGIATDKVKERTRRFVKNSIDTLCDEYGFCIQEISIRNFKAQWGSCSGNNRVKFHYKLSLLPIELRYYIVVHELCHTRHFNHSKAFWNEVGRICPHYKEKRKELRKYLL